MRAPRVLSTCLVALQASRAIGCSLSSSLSLRRSPSLASQAILPLLLFTPTRPAISLSLPSRTCPSTAETSSETKKKAFFSSSSSTMTKTIAFGSDNRSPLASFILNDLKSRGFDVQLFGPIAREEREIKETESTDEDDWPVVAAGVGRAVSSGKADEGILVCWTGTGVSMAANKISGIRAALCPDAETARGARKWNHANVLALSERMISTNVAKEILDVWFEAPMGADQWNLRQIERIRQLERDERQRENGQ